MIWLFPRFSHILIFWQRINKLNFIFLAKNLHWIALYLSTLLNLTANSFNLLIFANTKTTRFFSLVPSKCILYFPDRFIHFTIFAFRFFFCSFLQFQTFSQCALFKSAAACCILVFCCLTILLLRYSLIFLKFMWRAFLNGLWQRQS